MGSVFRPAIKRSGKPLAPRNVSIQPPSEGSFGRRAGLISESNCWNIVVYTPCVVLEKCDLCDRVG